MKAKAIRIQFLSRLRIDSKSRRTTSCCVMRDAGTLSTCFMEKISKNRLRPVPIECIGGPSVTKITLLLPIFFVSAFAVSASAAKSDSLNFQSQFVFKDRNGKTVSAPIVNEYQKKKIVYPTAKVDPRVNPKLMRAATIADERAHAHSKSRCWHYVKEALLASGAVAAPPQTALA